MNKMHQTKVGRKIQPFPDASGLAPSALCRDTVVSRQGAAQIPAFPRDRAQFRGSVGSPHDASLHCVQ